MKILDWYILKKYLATFFFICFIFTIVSVVVDFSEKMDDILEAKVSWGTIIRDYYLNFIPYINSILWPLFSLIAVIFFTSRMATNTEFIAIIGGGVNFYRLLVPYITGSLIIGTLLYFANHYTIPNGSKVRTVFENTYIYKNNFEFKAENLHFRVGDNEEIYMRTYSPSDSTGRDFTLVKYKGNTVLSKLSAASIKPIKGKHKNWQMSGWRYRTFDGLTEKVQEGASKDTIIQLISTEIMRRDNFQQAMTTPEMWAFIQREKERGSLPPLRYEVEAYRRTAAPFSILILSIMGMAVASRKVRGGMGIHLLIGAISAGVYMFLLQFSASFSIQGGLSPLLGVWIPNIIFAFVAVYMLLKAQK